MRWCVRTAQLAPGSAGIALECERASLTPQTPFRARCLVDHAGARSGVSIPTRTSIRWGEGPGRAWAAGAGGRRTGAFDARAAARGRRPCCGREREGGGERVGVRRSREDGARERVGGRSDIQGRLDPHRRRIRPSLGGSLRMECIFLARALANGRGGAAAAHRVDDGAAGAPCTFSRSERLRQGGWAVGRVVRATSGAGRARAEGGGDGRDTRRMLRLSSAVRQG